MTQHPAMQEAPASPIGAPATLLLCAALLGFLALRAGLEVASGPLEQANEMIAEYYRPVRVAADEVSGFGAKKKDEKDFSLAFDLAASDSLSTWHGIPMTTVLFRQYENNFNPKYVVQISNNQLLARPLEEYRQRHDGRK